MSTEPDSRLFRPVNSVNSRQLTRLLGHWSHVGIIYTDLAAAIRDAITDGRLQPDTRIPAERSLAQALRVSRNSVAAAYRVLRSEGYLRSKRGAGTFTAIPLRSVAATRPAEPRTDAPGEIDLSLACLAPPEPLLGNAILEAALQRTIQAGEQGYDLVGIPSLREAVADRFTQRGLPTRPSEIMITNGAQHAWTLLLHMLVGSGDRVMIEVPSHPSVQTAVRVAGGRPVPVSVTAAGWDTEMMEATLKKVRPALSYMMPDFQNPTGHVMPAAARRAVIDAARVSGTPLAVEDTLAELNLGPGQQLPPPPAAYANSSQVLTVGSMSKVCWSGLRVGWIRAAPSLIDQLTRLRRLIDPGNPILQQYVAVRILERYGDLVWNRREQLRAQRDALTGALRERIPEWSFSPSAGGLSLWVDLGHPVSTRLARTASEQGVRLTAGPRYGLDGTLERYVRIPYVHPVETLVEAVRRLELALAEAKATPRAARRPAAQSVRV